MSSKLCKRCSKEKPLTDFHKAARLPDGRHTWCKACYKVYSKEYESRPNVKKMRKASRSRFVKKQPSDYKKSLALKKKYGITLDDKKVMLEKQLFKCANSGCQVSLDLTSGHLDHCHTTGKVRGILCRNCNQGLGHFKDSTKLLSGAIKYLMETNNATLES